MVSSFSMMLISSLFILIISIYFFTKEHVNTVELKLYKALLLIDFVGLIFEMSSYVSIKYFPDNFMTIVINKFYLLFFIFLLMFSFVMF